MAEEEGRGVFPSWRLHTALQLWGKVDCFKLQRSFVADLFLGLPLPLSCHYNATSTAFELQTFSVGSPNWSLVCSEI